MESASMICEPDPDFDLDIRQRELAEGPQREPADALRDICEHSLDRAEAARRLIQKGHSRTVAYRLIQQALEEGLQRREGNILQPC